MLQNPRLGAPAFATVHMHALFSWPNGWRLVVSARREGSELFERDEYDRLDVFELHEVLTSDLAHKLGI